MNQQRESSNKSVHNLTCELLNDPQGIDTEKPRLSWQLRSRSRGVRQTAYQIVVASNLKLLESGEYDLWDSGKAESPQSTLIEYHGKPLASRTVCYWKVRIWNQHSRVSAWSRSAVWTMGLLSLTDWAGKWIGMDASWNDLTCPWLRKTFILDAVPDNAFAYIAAMGYYELYVNGNKIDDHVLSPAVSQYSKRVWYVTHNVSRYLHKGKNCIALWAARGWYRPGMAGVEHPTPLLRAQLDVQINDSWQTAVKTNQCWKTYPSHITQTGSWKGYQTGGEIIDQRQFIPQWSEISFADACWTNAAIYKVDRIKICSQMVEPNRIQRTIHPKTIQQLDSGELLIDMGTTLTGWFEMKLPRMIAGQVVEFGYFDTLNVKNNIGFGQFDTYIAAGGQGEYFCNKFNYHGFRYVKIKGLSIVPSQEDIKAYFIHTDFLVAGRFTSSNKLLNGIHDMTAYTLRCLSMGGVVVDCPHRERLGYGGDGQSAIESITMMYQAAPLLKNWTAAWLDCQQPDGDMPHTAPNPYQAGGGPIWCGFLLTSTYYCYLYYGDLRIVSTNYAAIKKWLEFVEENCENHILKQWPPTDYRSWCLADWAVPKGVDSKHPQSIDLINNCFRIYCYDLAIQLAEALNRESDSKKFRQLMTSARIAVHEAFFNPMTNTYADGDQLDLAFPLLTGVVPEYLHNILLKKLEEEILIKCNSHFAVGLTGVYFLQKQLLASNRNDLMSAMASQTTYPGYGYMLKKGATTMWEYWDGSQSHIHNCYNAIGAWFYHGLAGIRPDPAHPGFANVIIKPAVVDNLKYVHASYRSIHGEIQIKWHLKKGFIELKVIVPANTTATVCVPTTDTGQIREILAENKKLCQQSDKDPTVFQVLSGTYIFIAPWRNSTCSSNNQLMDIKIQMETDKFKCLVKDKL